jgi:hypothetical protein
MTNGAGLLLVIPGEQRRQALRGKGIQLSFPHTPFMAMRQRGQTRAVQALFTVLNPS